MRLDTPFRLDAALLRRIHDKMAEGRALEERLIGIKRVDLGYFWIGGPGEEAFNVPLGLLLKKGEGLDYDYLHHHYRNSATLLAMDEPPIGAIRQMMQRATDPYSAGRNFPGHYSKRAWNIVPGVSPVEVQYVMALGTARAQRRPGCTGLTVVTGGDAGTAEGDFASSLVWSNRPGQELPLLLLVTNNGWGISTSASTQHAERSVADRAAPFGIRAATIDGNDPEASYLALAEALDYVRTHRRPYLLEAHVSRLYGHSSSSGGNRVDDEPDCLALFEERLVAAGVLSAAACADVRERHAEGMAELVRIVRDDPSPMPQDIWKHIYAGDA